MHNILGYSIGQPCLDSEPVDAMNQHPAPVALALGRELRRDARPNRRRSTRGGRGWTGRPQHLHRISSILRRNNNVEAPRRPSAAAISSRSADVVERRGIRMAVSSGSRSVDGASTGQTQLSMVKFSEPEWTSGRSQSDPSWFLRCRRFLERPPGRRAARSGPRGVRLASIGTIRLASFAIRIVALARLPRFAEAQI